MSCKIVDNMLGYTTKYEKKSHKYKEFDPDKKYQFICKNNKYGECYGLIKEKIGILTPTCPECKRPMEYYGEV